MTEDRLPLAELLTKAGDGIFLRTVAEAVMQLLMEADVEGMIGAGRHERALDLATIATAIGTARSTPGLAPCNFALRSFGRPPPRLVGCRVVKGHPDGIQGY